LVLNRVQDVLDLVYIDICGPFPTASWNGHEYFIIFIDNYSRYGYLYLLHEKSQSLDMFKIYKAKVENQLNRKIKAVRSDRGGEYYDRYDGSGVALSLSTPCQGYLVKMVLLRGKITH